MKRILLGLMLLVLVLIANAAIGRAQTGKKTADTESEVRLVFDKWSTALTRGDKKTYLDTFLNSPRLVIRVADGEWRGFDAYSKRIQAAQLPPGNPTDYQKVEVVALSSDAAVVTYERPAPGQANANAGQMLVFRGTVVFTRTADGWKIAAWHAHAVSDKSSAH